MSMDSTQIVSTIFQNNAGEQMGAFAKMADSASRAGLAIQGVRAILQQGIDLATGGPLRGLAQIHSAFEDSINSIAGSLEAVGAASAHSSVAIATEAYRTLDEIAARLPGETDQYLTMYQASVSEIVRGGRSAVEAATLVGNIGAVAISRNIDAQQAGMDFMRIIEGHAGVEVRYWREVASKSRVTLLNGHVLSRQQLENLTTAQRHHTIERANTSLQQLQHMSVRERVNLLEQSAMRSQGMIDRAQHTWGAITGTFNSLIKAITRISTAPIFEEMKRSLDGLNDYITSIRDKLTRYGRALSTFFVTIFGHVKDYLGSFSGIIARHMNGLWGWFERLLHHPVLNRMVAFGGQTANWVRQQAGTGAGARTMAAGALGGAAAALGVPALPVVGTALGGLMEFATHTRALNATLDNLWRIAESVVTKFKLLFTLSEHVNVALGHFFAGLLPKLTGAMATVMQNVVGIIAKTVQYGVWLADHLAGPLAGLGSALGTVAQMIASLSSTAGPLLAAFFVLKGIVAGASVVMSTFSATVVGASGALAMSLLGLAAILLMSSESARSYALQASTELGRTLDMFVDTLKTGAAMLWGALRIAYETITHPIDAGRQGTAAYNRITAIAQETLSNINHYADMFEHDLMADRSAVARVQDVNAQMPQALQDLLTALRDATAPVMEFTEEEVYGTHPLGGDRNQRGGSVTNFYNNRFDITQKFSEGFDPDRIAGAMVSDIEHLADQRVDSAFTTAFGAGS
jgi:hypothetical protein